MKVIVKPNETATLMAYYNPIRKGRISCEIKLTIVDNPYEYFTVSNSTIFFSYSRVRSVNGIF